MQEATLPQTFLAANLSMKAIYADVPMPFANQNGTHCPNYCMRNTDILLIYDH